MENTQTVETEVVETVETVETEAIETDLDALILEQQNLLNEREEMQKQMAKLTEQVEQSKKESFNNLLKNEGLEEFASFFEETDKLKQVEILKGAVDAILIKNSYVPQDKAKQDAYDAAINKGDVQGALAQKLSNFGWFKK